MHILENGKNFKSLISVPPQELEKQEQNKPKANR